MPPAANRKPARVKVKLTADWDNQHQNVVFDPSSRIWSHSHKMYRFNKIKEGMKESDYHEVEFVLEDDKTGLGLRLPQDPKDAFWVKRYISADPSHCPNANDVSDYSVFEPVSRADD